METNTIKQQLIEQIQNVICADETIESNEPLRLDHLTEFVEENALAIEAAIGIADTCNLQIAIGCIYEDMEYKDEAHSMYQKGIDILRSLVDVCDGYTYFYNIDEGR